MKKKAPEVKAEPVKEVKPVVRKYTESEKKFIFDNNREEYIRQFGDK